MYSLGNYPNLVILPVDSENCACTLVCRVARDRQRVARGLRRLCQLFPDRTGSNGRVTPSAFLDLRPAIEETTGARLSHSRRGASACGGKDEKSFLSPRGILPHPPVRGQNACREAVSGNEKRESSTERDRRHGRDYTTKGFTAWEARMYQAVAPVWSAASYALPALDRSITGWLDRTGGTWVPGARTPVRSEE